jgi:hypothetical protein
MFAGRNFKRARLSKVWLASSLLVALAAHGQGSLIYDQQSPDPRISVDGDILAQTIQQTAQQRANPTPLFTGQIFTPLFDSIGFVQLDIGNGNRLPGNVRVELLSSLISKTVLGTSTSIAAPSGTDAKYYFYFTTPIALTPGQSYFIHPVSDVANVFVGIGGYGYTGGHLIKDGAVWGNYENYWFGEGIIAAPEPSAVSLVLGGGIVFYVCRKKIHIG